MQFSLRTLLIVLTIGPPVQAGLVWVVSNNWPLIVLLGLASVPSALMLLVLEMGTILRWVFRKQIEEDKVRIARIRERRDI